MDLNISWSNLYKLKNGLWRREWIIPIDFRNGFFQFWNKSKFDLWKQGFSVTKRGNDWVLLETKALKENFKGFSVDEKKKQEEIDSFVLPKYNIKNKDGLREWQTQAVESLVSSINHWKFAIDGSDMGVGKTYTSLGVLRELNVPFVIVCPKTIISKWKKIVKEHFKLDKNLIGVINYELLIRGRKDSKIASYIKDKKNKNKKEKFTWLLPENSIILWDEAHRLKNFKTKNSKTCIAAYKQGYRMLFLSATLASSPLDLRTIGMCFGIFSTANQYYEWLQTHGCSQGYFGMQFNNDVKILKKIHTMLFEQRGIRLRRDLIPNFPESEVIIDSYDMDDESTKQINEIYNEMKKELKLIEYKIKNDKSDNELTIRLRALQKTEILKIPLIDEMIKEGIEDGFSVVVFLNFSDSIDALAERLNTQCIYDGRTKDVIREENLNNFQENKERIIICNSGAAREGLDFGDSYGGHPRLSIISPNDSERKIQQVCGRIWREDSKTKSIQKLVYISNTAEQDVVNNLNQKLKNMSLINNGILTDSDFKI